MLALQVHAACGHYRIPKAVAGGGGSAPQVHSFSVAPISTIRGFLESLVGAQPGEFDGRYAYGYMEKPEGHGWLYRTSHVWASPPISGPKAGLEEAQRPMKVEMYFDVAYIILVQGVWIERVKVALQGEVKRYGCLYLGDSEGLVTWVGEYLGPLQDIEWLRCGNKMPLPKRAPYGYDTLDTPLVFCELSKGEPYFWA